MKNTFYDKTTLPCIIQYSSHMSVNSCSNYVFIFVLVLYLSLLHTWLCIMTDLQNVNKFCSIHNSYLWTL